MDGFVNIVIVIGDYHWDLEVWVNKENGGNSIL